MILLLNILTQAVLQHARQLLETQQFATAAEVACVVGYAGNSYFSKVYQKRFGVRPSEVMSL